MKKNKIKLILILSISGLFSFECKRRNRSSVSEEQQAQYLNAFQQSQKKLFEIDLFVRRTMQNPSPLLPDENENWSSYDSNKIVPAPNNCSEEKWKDELQWNGLIDLWRNIVGGETQEVKLKSLEALAKIGKSRNLSCWRQLVEELMPTVFNASPPSGLIYKQPENGFVCSGFISCGKALEIVISLGKIMSNSNQVMFQLERVITSVQSLNLFKLKHFLVFQAQSARAYLKFLNKTRMFDSDFVGRELTLSSQEIFELKNNFEINIQKYTSSELSGLPIWENYNFNRNNNSLSQITYAKLLNEILGDEYKNFGSLPKDEQQIVIEWISQFITNFNRVQHFNLGMYWYVDRFAQKDPSSWIQKMYQMVGTFKQIESQSFGNNKSVAEAIENRFPNLENLNGIYNQLAIPEAVFMALAQHFRYEAYMPWREDMKNFAIRVFQQIPTSEIKNVGMLLSEIKSDLDYVNKLKEQFINGVTGGQSKESPFLTEKIRLQANRINNALTYLFENEKQIISDPRMHGFQSTYFEINKFNRFMVDYHLLQETMVHIKTQDPLSLYQKLFETVDNPHINTEFQVYSIQGDLLGQYLVLLCTNWKFNQNSSPPLEETFYVDGETKIEYGWSSDNSKFECNRNETFMDMKSKAYRYAFKTTQDRVNNKAYELIKNHPFTHTAMMLGMSVGIGGATGLLFKGATKFAALAKAATAIRAATGFYKYGATFSKLMFDSFVFGISEYNVSDAMDKYIGRGFFGATQSQSEEEAKHHYDALFNVTGIIKGAVIFGLIPQAHHFGKFFIQKSIGKKLIGDELLKASLEAQHAAKFFKPPPDKAWNFFAYKMLSGTAEFNAEAAVFIFSPVIEEKGNELYQKAMGTYRELTPEQTEIMKLHMPSLLERIVNAYITASAFSANRFTTQSLSYNYPELTLSPKRWLDRVRSEGDYQQMYAVKDKANLYELVGVSEGKLTDNEIQAGAFIKQARLKNRYEDAMKNLKGAELQAELENINIETLKTSYAAEFLGNSQRYTQLLKQLEKVLPKEEFEQLYFPLVDGKTPRETFEYYMKRSGEN